ncbi:MULTISPECIES: hypothetical protein [unclassified Polaribacter]|uniref:hypothetical protein n=1 Tax=unclassified Polaribacter TaxID=196858 RepID=UPI0011BFA8A7|nr:MULTISPECIES: hypothetical protein [unclassified Polaribacter]TXD50852.1 hypothetical protein ES043_14365 [Polaribacter sp. IC063]TXD57677.1 hypothetical protein ES044_14370 [Polaribacter sp. IC066]
MKKIVFVISFMSSLILVSQTVTSIQNGSWNHRSTWAGGIIPTKNSDVVIAHEVLVDSPLNQINNLVINSPSGKISILESKSVTLRGTIENNNYIRLTIADMDAVETLILKFTYSGVGYTWAAYRPITKPYKLVYNQLKKARLKDDRLKSEILK